MELILQNTNILILKKILFIRIVVIIWIIFFLNFIASKLYLYSLIWWFDMPMHFFGGVFLALFGVWLFIKTGLIKKFDTVKLFLFSIGIFVLLVGMLWEIFEIGNIVFITFDKFNVLDTTSDLFFDLSGGLFGIFYTLKKAQRFVVNKNIEV